MSGAPARALVRLPNWIGDIVMATPLLAALREAWPQTHLGVAGPAHVEPILAGSGLIDQLHVFGARRETGLGGIVRHAAELRRADYDLALLLTNSFSSALVVALGRVPRRIGYAGGGRELLLTESLPTPQSTARHRLPTPMVEHYGRLLDRLGVPRGSHRTRLATTPEEEDRAEAWLERHELLGEGPLFGLHPGSSFGPSKLWLPERFAQLADRLHERHGGRCVVFCGPSEHGLARSIATAARTQLFPAAEDPIDLGTLKAVVRRLALLVSTDTGPRHFAAPFDVPCVVLMGSTDPRFTNTNLARSLVVRSGVACSPCQLKVCPIDHRCMTRLGVDAVMGAAERLLAG